MGNLIRAETQLILYSGWTFGRSVFSSDSPAEETYANSDPSPGMPGPALQSKACLIIEKKRNLNFADCAHSKTSKREKERER